jgi:hypothetical protein
MDGLAQYYILLVPAAVGALGLGVYWLTGWMDRREDRRLRRRADRAADWGAHTNG